MRKDSIPQIQALSEVILKWAEDLTKVMIDSMNMLEPSLMIVGLPRESIFVT